MILALMLELMFGLFNITVIFVLLSQGQFGVKFINFFICIRYV